MIKLVSHKFFITSNVCPYSSKNTRFNLFHFIYFILQMIKKFIYIIAFQFIKYVSMCRVLHTRVWMSNRQKVKTGNVVYKKQIKIKLSDEIKQNLINHIVVYILLCKCCEGNILQPNFILFYIFIILWLVSPPQSSRRSQLLVVFFSFFLWR